MKPTQETPQPHEWSVYEDGYGILEWHPKHKDGLGMLCRCHDRMEAQYTVDAHNAALAAQRDKHAFELAAEVEKAYDKGRQHNDVAISQSLREQLAAERKNVLTLVDALDYIAEGEHADEAPEIAKEALARVKL